MGPRAVKWRTMDNGHYAIQGDGKCRALSDTADQIAVVPEMVGLLPGIRPTFHGWASGSTDSRKRFGFSARKSCVKKRLGISDENGRFLIHRKKQTRDGRRLCCGESIVATPSAPVTTAD